ncbi:MAG: N-acetyltransferase [Alphaproteobacteria bacterium]|nr:N-acetyltransferase [Alphaproteobacteria bacterium]
MLDTAIRVRPAEPADGPEIRAVVKRAFGRCREAELVEGLRTDGDLALSLVADIVGLAVVGHVGFSRLAIMREAGEVGALALAPLAVLPGWQRRGVGGALVEHGIAACRRTDAAAIVVLGDPAYYPRFGFSAAAAATLSAPFKGAAFMALELRPGLLAGGGRLRYAPAFGIAAPA